jgi:hypothetical protein
MNHIPVADIDQMGKYYITLHLDIPTSSLIKAPLNSRKRRSQLTCTEMSFYFHIDVVLICEEVDFLKSYRGKSILRKDISSQISDKILKHRDDVSVIRKMEI